MGTLRLITGLIAWQGAVLVPISNWVDNCTFRCDGSVFDLKSAQQGGTNWYLVQYQSHNLSLNTLPCKFCSTLKYLANTQFLENFTEEQDHFSTNTLPKLANR